MAYSEKTDNGPLKKADLYQSSLYELKTHFWQNWGCGCDNGFLKL